MDGMRPVIDPYAPNPSCWDQLAVEISIGKVVVDYDHVVKNDRTSISHLPTPLIVILRG